MKYHLSISERTFHFKQPAGTSRGVYRTRQSYFISLVSNVEDEVKGIGECATLPDLSCDAVPDYKQILQEACLAFEEDGTIDYEQLRPYPSILFGLETALAQWNAHGSWALFDTPFGRGEEGIVINGLVWMGSFDEMYARINEKIEQGFRCVKLKVGAIDFEKELELVKFIRSNFSKSDIEIRLDANGGFTVDNALSRLERLAVYDIHSIEQPINQHRWKEMAKLCKDSPIPIALDEELIGVNLLNQKEILLDSISPAYIILKPSLHGGMHGTEEWISLARERKIGSWMTSALESNVGLNAIAQWAAKVYGPKIIFPQGLGTGQLFTDNIPSPLEIKGDQLWFSSMNNGGL